MDRDWPWVQSGFFTLHTLVMIMKMHSYMNINGYLQSVSEQSQALLKQLRAATNSEGGWEHAISVAKEHRAELDGPSTLTDSTQSSPPGSSPIGTPPIVEGAKTSYVDPDTAKALRKRLASMSLENGALDREMKNIVRSLDDPGADKKTDEPMPSATSPHPLVDHPNETIANIAKEYSEVHGELASTGPLYVTWPNNITFQNFGLYMLIPTLVYELEYPRTNR